MLRDADRKPSKPGGGRVWRAVKADALDPESLVEAFEGIELVYYLIHSMAAGRDFRNSIAMRRPMYGTLQQMPE